MRKKIEHAAAIRACFDGDEVLSKPDLSSSGVGTSVDALRLRRQRRIDRALGKIEADLNRDTFFLEAQQERLKIDREAIGRMSESDLRALEAKLERKNWLRHIRLIMTGQKNTMANPPSPYRVFKYIYDKWHDADEPDVGVPLLIKQIAKGVHLSPDYVKEILHPHIGPHIHIERRGRRPSLYRPKCPY